VRILITGGAGFVGCHLAEHLLGQGDEVWAVDDLSTGSIENLEHIKGHPRFHYQIENIMNAPAVAELVDRCDVVFHLAAAVGVRLIVESPVRTIETNIRGTEIILAMAAKKKKLVVLPSTSEVYGKAAKVPFCEDDDLVIGPTVKGRWSYACSKAIDEFLALAYWKEKKLPVIIARLFNTVGPRQTGRYGMVVPNFVRQALDGEPITVYGDGQQSRCFGYVKDAVNAVALLLATDSAVGQVVNIGNDQEITIEGLAKARLPGRMEIIHQDPRILLEDFGDGGEGQTIAIGEAAAFADRGRIGQGAQQGDEFLLQPGFPHAGCAQHGDQVYPLLARHPIVQPQEQVHLFAASNQRRLTARDAALHSLGAQAHNLPGLHRL